MSKGVKTLVSVAAAVAVPFVAPAIAASLGTSMVVSGALAGAGLQAAAAAVTGGNVGRAALLGGVGGGLYGYSATPTASPYSLGPGGGAPVSAAAAPVQAGPAGLPLGGAGISTDYGLSAGLQFPGQGLTPTGGVGLQVGDAGGFMSAADRALAAGVPFDYGLSSGMAPSTGLRALSVAPDGGVSTITGAGAFPTTTPSDAFTGGGFSPTLAGPQAASAPAAAGAPQTFSEALSRIPGEIAGKFKDPKALADMTLRAAGALAGSAFAGSGLSPEERSLMDAQAEELRRLQATNEGLFRQKLEQAQALIGEAKYFDPEYFGIQSARRAQTQGAIAQRERTRGLTGERLAGEQRRFALGTGRNVGTAYDVGYSSAIAPRLQTMQVGLSNMPTFAPYQTPATSALLDAAGRARRQRAEDISGFGQLYGSILGIPQAQSTPQTR